MVNETTRWTVILFGIGMILTIIFWLFGDMRVTWLRFINVAAMVGLAYIAIGGFMFVYYGGFFRGLAFSFRMFFRGKGEIYAEELSKSWEEHDRPNRKKTLPERLNYGIGKKRPPITWAFIINAFIFFLGSLALSYLIYY
jgi:hypothetical protein